MSQPFVLVVHEDPRLLQLLGAALENAGYDCATATNGDSALAAIDRRVPDTVLLSLDLGDCKALDLCTRIRARTRTPIIALSENSSDSRKIAALDAGADDYVTVPFSLPEVLARLRVALRHRHELGKADGDSVIQVGAVRLDPDGHAAAIGNRVLALTPKEFELLLLLARNSDRVLTHRSILDAIWPNSTTHDSLRLHISQLRKKLAPAAGAPLLVTVSGVGYRLVAPAD